MSPLNNDDGPIEIDPTIDALCYLLAITIEVVNPRIDRAIAHELLVEMIEDGDLNEKAAYEVGAAILASSEMPEGSGFH